MSSKGAGRNTGSKPETCWPDQMRSLRKLEGFLCSLAKMPHSREPVKVDMCRQCRMCAYGKQYVKLYEQKNEKEKRKMPTNKKPVDELTLEEQLAKERKRAEEVNQINVELASKVQLAEKQIEDARHKAAEDHIEIQSLRLTAIRLKARLWDMEHPDDHF